MEIGVAISTAAVIARNPDGNRGGNLNRRCHCEERSDVAISKNRTIYRDCFASFTLNIVNVLRVTVQTLAMTIFSCRR